MKKKNASETEVNRRKNEDFIAEDIIPETFTKTVSSELVSKRPGKKYINPSRVRVCLSVRRLVVVTVIYAGFDLAFMCTTTNVGAHQVPPPPNSCLLSSLFS
jgi:hypothetical protein